MREREIGQYRWGKMCVGGFGFKFREIRSDDGVRERGGNEALCFSLALLLERERDGEGNGAVYALSWKSWGL